MVVCGSSPLSCVVVGCYAFIFVSFLLRFVFFLKLLRCNSFSSLNEKPWLPLSVPLEPHCCLPNLSFPIRTVIPIKHMLHSNVTCHRPPRLRSLQAHATSTSAFLIALSSPPPYASHLARAILISPAIILAS